MQPWEAWLTLAVLTALYAKFRLLAYDLSRREQECNYGEDYLCNYYTGAAIVDGIFVSFLLIFLAWLVL